MAALASDWLRHFRLLLLNYWTEFNDTCQDVRSQRPLQSLCFGAHRKKQDDRPDVWLVETFSTSPMQPLNGIQRNLTGSRIFTSSTKFVFFEPIRKNKIAVLSDLSIKLAHCTRCPICALLLFSMGAVVTFMFFALSIGVQNQCCFLCTESSLRRFEFSSWFMTPGILTLGSQVIRVISVTIFGQLHLELLYIV